MSNTNSLAGRLLRNSTWNLFAYAVIMATGILTAPIYIKFLGLSHYGLFVLLNSILAPLGLLNVGFGRATIKYIAEAVGAGQPEHAGDYLRTTLLFNLCIGVLGSALLFGLAPWLIGSVFKIALADTTLARTALHWTALNWLLAQVSNTFASVPIALQRFKISSLLQSTQAVLNFGVGLAVLFAGGGLVELLAMRFVLGLFIGLCWVLACWQMLPGVSLWPKHHGWAFRQTFRFSAWQTAAQAGGMLGSQADKMVIGAFLSTAAIGLFNVPFLVFSTGYTVTMKAGEVVFPAISQLQGEGKLDRVVGVFARASWILCTLMVGIQGAVYVFASDILRLYVGPDFTGDAVQVLRILAFTAILSSPAIGMEQYLLGTGRTHWTAIIGFVSGILVLLISLILIPRYGLAGAAWSDLLAIVLTRPLLHGLIWRDSLREHLGLSEFIGYLYGPAMVSMVPTAIAGYIYGWLGWQPELPALIIGFSALVCLFIFMVVIFDILPEHQQRRKDLISILDRAVGYLGFNLRA